MKKIIIIIIIIMLIIIGSIGGAFAWYNSGLGPTNSENAKEVTLEIESGTSTDNIIKELENKELIKSALAAKVYIRLNGVKGLQAGKYTLSSSMSLEEILNQIAEGKVKDEKIKITFLEGKNIRGYAKEIAANTNNTEQDVFDLLEDKEYIQSLIDKYWFLTDEILNEDIYYPLEGYLYPDTYNFIDKDVSVKTIFNILLNQEEKVLNKYKAQLEQSKYSVHEILSMAAVVELESSSKEARAGIASVFYNRLKANMSLGSDVTTYYGIKVDMSERGLYATELNTYNPYNTRGPNMAGKLPVGPISSVSEESINAALNPLDTNYLYFVSDINNVDYFSATYAEHQKKIQELKDSGLWYTH